MWLRFPSVKRSELSPMFQDKAGVLIGHEMLLINSGMNVVQLCIDIYLNVIYICVCFIGLDVYCSRDCVLSFGHSYSEIVFAAPIRRCASVHFWRSGCLTEVGFSPNLTTTSRNAKREQKRCMKHREDTLETTSLTFPVQD